MLSSLGLGQSIVTGFLDYNFCPAGGSKAEAGKAGVH